MIASRPISTLKMNLNNEFLCKNDVDFEMVIWLTEGDEFSNLGIYRILTT
jgi:hypothetical protein